MVGINCNLSVYVNILEPCTEFPLHEDTSVERSIFSGKLEVSNLHGESNIKWFNQELYIVHHMTDR